MDFLYSAEVRLLKKYFSAGKKRTSGVYAAERHKHFWSRCYVSRENWEKGKKSCGVSFNSRECTALTRPMSTVLGSRTHTSGNVQHGETGTPHLTCSERAVRPATYSTQGQISSFRLINTQMQTRTPVAGLAGLSPLIPPPKVTK